VLGSNEAKMWYDMLIVAVLSTCGTLVSVIVQTTVKKRCKRFD
jgi:hypothetical protein